MTEPEPLDSEIEAWARALVYSVVAAHRNLGPGLLESVYEKCLCHELSKRRVAYATQQVVPIVYDGVPIESGLRLDLLVNGHFMVEIKILESILPVHTAQALTYLKITGLRLALLINFNVKTIRSGIRRIIL